MGRLRTKLITLIDRRWHSSILDVQSFSRADCRTDHYLLVAKFREKLAGRKQTAQTFGGERFNLRKLHDLKVRKQYHIETTNRRAAFENLSNEEGINRTWENIKEDMKTPATESLDLHEVKQYKPWFDEGCLGFLYQRKQAKM